jgi:hypothetical protein
MTATTFMKDWERTSAGSADITKEQETPVPQSRVYDRLREILGYDVQEQLLMMEGYREFAEESLTLAESTLEVGVEALPAEEPEE